MSAVRYLDGLAMSKKAAGRNPHTKKAAAAVPDYCATVRIQLTCLDSICPYGTSSIRLGATSPQSD